MEYHEHTIGMASVGPITHAHEHLGAVETHTHPMEDPMHTFTALPHGHGNVADDGDWRKLPHAPEYRADPVVAIRDILAGLGLDTQSQHFIRTPERFIKVLRSYVQPIDLDAVLSGGFEDDDPSQEGEKSDKTLVVQTAIPFMGLCAHHLLPFFGSAAVGYLPRDRVVGLSKLTRLVYAAGHMAPTTQEHITNLVADTLSRSKTINPKGVAVLTSALHGCMAVRGVEAPGTRTIASAIRGDIQEYPALESKFMVLAMKGLD